MSEFKIVPLSSLILDGVNARNIGHGEVDPVFVASIRAHGVKLPLSVRPTNGGKKYSIVDGSKRFAALQALRKEGAIADDHLVAVRIETNDEAQARETSLTLNIVRTALHPVDEYRAFAKLSLSVDDISKRFGVDRKTVEQRLALGNLDDTILDAWVTNNINEAAAMAFTLVANKSLQAKLYAKLNKLDRATASAIKAEVRAGQDNAGGLLALVGLDAYEKAGGKVTRDLFGTDHVVSDVALLNDMASVKFNAKVKELLEEGWGWACSGADVQERWKYGHIEAKFAPTNEEKKRLKQLEKRMRADDVSYEDNDEARAQHDTLRQTILLRGITPKQKKESGCFLTLDHRGLVIEYGRTRPAATKETTAKRKNKDKDAKRADLTKAVQERLDAAKQAAVKHALLRHPHKDPLAKLLARVVSDGINPGRWNYANEQTRQAFDALAKLIAPKVLTVELVGIFNIADYAKGASKSLLLSVIKEACGVPQFRLNANKSKGELVKFVAANVRKGWLPKELRVK